MQKIALRKNIVKNSVTKNLRKKWYAKNSLNRLRRKLKEILRVGQEVPQRENLLWYL